MHKKWSNFLKLAQLTRFTGHCLFCQQPATVALCCHFCRSTLEKPSWRCQYCGCILAEDQISCGQCQSHRPPWHRAYTPFSYRLEMKYLVHQLKFFRQERVAHLLANLFLAQCVNLDIPDCLVPIPLHWHRRFRRGYNQAELLAQQLGRALKCRCDTSFLSKQKPTHTQTNLTRKQRQLNLKQAFICHTKHLAPPQHIALIDDVMTTGATFSSACKAIKSVYPHIQIDVWAICRA